MAIEVKDLSHLKLMRKAGLVVADTLKLLKQSAQIGMTTLELDEVAANNLAKHGATSSFLGYHGFPAVICASVNEEVVHGIPNKRKLVSGDILSIDFGAIVDGWHGDAAISFGLGEIDLANQKLMDVCQESMWRGIAAGKKGADDWTVVSHDSSTGAHFEHTYTITPDGKIFVLTAEDGGKEQLARLGVEVSDLL